MRARDDARQIAAQIAAMRHEPVLAPVIEIVALGHEAPAGSFDAILATSGHAFLGLGSGSALSREKPVFAVGERTAAAALAEGFTDVRVAGGDAAALAALVTASGPGHVLYLAARDRKPTLESALHAAGLRVTVREAYEAKVVAGWEQAVVALLRADGIGAALHFSRRSAALALQLAHQHDVQAELLALRHYCLSDDVAAPLLAMGATSVEIAAQPDAAHLLELLIPRRSNYA